MSFKFKREFSNFTDDEGKALQSSESIIDHPPITLEDFIKMEHLVSCSTIFYKDI